MKYVTLAEALQDLPCQAVNRDLLTEQVWETIKSPQFRKSSAADLAGETEKGYKQKIRAFIDRGEPIQFVLVAFPWKVWRMPLKTNRKTPDLGELAFLSQLKNLDATIRLKYAPGTHWTFLTEGRAYLDLFDVPAEETQTYVECVKRFTRILNADHLFSFRCLRSLLDEYPEFIDRYTEIHQQLQAECSTNNGTIPKRFRSFFGTFYSSQDLRHVDIGTIRKVFHQKSADRQELNAAELEIQEELGRRSKEMVLRYVAFNEAKHLVGQSGAIQDRFPDHLYISITQKAGRFTIFPIHPKAKLLPHHGVPVVRTDGRITIDWLDSVQHSEHPFVPIFLEEDTEDVPFYYKEC